MPTRFPQDRLAFGVDATGALRSGDGGTIVVYTDEEGLTLANITTPQGNPIPGAILRVGDDSLLPEFVDPLGRSRLWARPLGSTVMYPLDAITSDVVAGLVADFLATSNVVAEAADQAVEQRLEQHVNSATPHPAYDGMTDLTILFENRLV